VVVGGVVVPLEAVIAKAATRLRKRTMALADARVQLIAELLKGGGVVKLYGWELKPENPKKPKTPENLKP
jgi:hypothetical protein